MPIETIEPSTLFRSPLYAQVAVATGTRTVYIAGQVAYDEHERIVGVGDLAAQVEQAMLNVGRALAAVKQTGFQEWAGQTSRARRG